MKFLKDLNLSMTDKVIWAGIISIFSSIGAILISRDNLNHPLWITAAYFTLDMMLRGTTLEFENYTDSEMKTKLTFGASKLAAGSLLVTGAIFSQGAIVFLGLTIAAIFFLLGGFEVARGASLLADRLWEREVEREVYLRRIELQAQDVGAHLERITASLEQKEMEEALFTDLVDSLKEKES